MNFVEILLSDKLKDKNPMLDVLGSDRKVLQIACQDLTNYLKFHWNLVGKESSECELVEKLEKFFNENPAELEEFLNVWTGMWLRKWNERVKLLIGNENSNRWNKVTKILNNAEPLWNKLSDRHEMQEVVTSTLIKNGEICGTSILAENLLKMELGDEKKREYRSEGEQVISVMNATLRKARELAQSNGPLIFVKIDKGYYQSSR
jgi:CRISPR/Cas system CSM-associated protein Csm2 small subunit